MKKLLLLIAVAFVLNNASAQWQSGGPVGLWVQSLTVSGSSNVFAGTEINGIYLSTDDGGSWTPVNNGVPANTGISAMATSGSNIFAGTNTFGMYLSTNNGASWSAVNSGLPANANIAAIAISGSNIFVGTGINDMTQLAQGIYLSTNNGGSWTAVNTGLPSNTEVNSIAISGSNIFAGTGTDMYLSANNGASWASVNTGLSTSINSVAVSGSKVYAGTFQNGVYVSSNNGASWTAMNSGIVDPDVIQLGATSAGILMTAIAGEVYFAANQDTNWITVNTGIPEYGGQATTNFILAFASNSSTVFGGTSGDGVWQQALNDVTGIEEIPLADYRIYPNPSQGNWQLVVDNNLLGSSLEIFDDNGQTVFKSEIQGLKSEIPASGLPAGIYYLRISNGQSSIMKKAVKIY